jgi:hypothetical protein
VSDDIHTRIVAAPFDRALEFIRRLRPQAFGLERPTSRLRVRAVNARLPAYQRQRKHQPHPYQRPNHHFGHELTFLFLVLRFPVSCFS